MVDRNGLEIIFDGDAALYFVGHHQCFEDVGDGERFAAAARQMIGQHENAGQIVRGMTALRGGERIVHVEPADHRAKAEGCAHRVEYVLCAWNPRAVRYYGAFNHRADQLGAIREVERVECAGHGVGQAQSRRVDGRAADFEIHHIVCDVGEFAIERRTCVCCHGWFSRFVGCRAEINSKCC